MRHRPITCIALCFLTAFFLLAYPLYVIRPFRYQGAKELAAVLVVLRYRVDLEIVLAAVALIVLIGAWNRAGTRSRVLLGLLASLVVACSALSHVNVYEKMFHPLDRPTFSAVTNIKLEGDEQVIAVRVNNVARAYPIRSMSYHHIVNDKLGGRAIVATY